MEAGKGRGLVGGKAETYEAALPTFVHGRLELLDALVAAIPNTTWRRSSCIASQQIRRVTGSGA